MKAFLPSLLLLLAVASNFLNAGCDPVLDTDGQPVRRGQQYYIVPPSPGAGGGLTLEANKGRCPYEIVQAINDSANGLPVTFNPADNDNDDNEIEEDDDLNIKFIDFQDAARCPESKVWKFNASQQQAGAPQFVTIGGVEGNPGPQTLTNWFKIIENEGYGNRRSYRLQYCPSPELCENRCRVVCGDIGVVIYDGKRRLAVNESPLSVVFKKA